VGVGRRLDRDAITDRALLEAAHLAARIGDDAGTIVQMDAETPIWNDFFDQAIEDQKILLGQASDRCFEIDGGLLAATIGLDLVAQPLVLLKRHHAGALHGADVDEAVIAAIVGLDETKALVGIEEFNGANRHEIFPFHENKNDPPGKSWQSW
jgi:hypothetical protein